MSTAADDTILSDPPEELVRALPQEAQRHLDALRGAIDLRLAALEAALADPSRTGALESLIIDLARVATVEAQAAATKACIDTRLAAETQTARAAAAANLVLQQERAAAAEVRRALDESETKRVKAETELAAHATKARHAAEAEKVRRDAAAADAERVLNDVRAKSKQALNELNRDLAASRKEAERLKHDFEKERAANIELKKSGSTTEERLADLKKDHEQTRLLHEQTVADLGRARDAVAETQQALDHARAEAQQERAAAQEARVALDKANERVASVESDYEQLIAELDRLKSSHEDSLAQLTSARESAANLERQVNEVTAALAQTRDAYEAEQASSADLLRQVEGLTAQLTALGPEQDEARRAQAKLVDDLDRANQHAAELEQARAAIEQRLQQERDEARAAASAATNQIEQISTRLREAESERGKLKVDHKVVLADLEALRETNQALDRQRGELERERAQFEEQVARLEARVRDLALQLETERTQSAGVRETADQAEQRLASIVGTQVQAMAHHEELGRQLAAAKEEIVTLKTELNETTQKLSKAMGEKAGAIERLIELEAQHNAATRDRAPAPQAAATNLGLIIEEGAASVVVDPAQSKAAARQAPGDSEAATASQWMPVRLAERYRFREPLTVPINGDSGLLCDLSTLGCQLVSSSALKPNQKIRVVIPSTVPLTCTGKVMWARLEASPKGRGFGYRVGVQFAPAAQATLDTLAGFIEERRNLEARPV